MAKKICIEIEVNPTVEALKSFDNDIETLEESEIEMILTNLLHRLDGFDIKNDSKLTTWAGSKVNICSIKV